MSVRGCAERERRAEATGRVLAPAGRTVTGTVLGLLALAGLAVTVAALGWLHAVPTGLSPLRNAVSQYGIGSHRGGYRVATIAFGTAGAALAVGAQTGPAFPGCVMVTGLMCLFAAARLSISWAPMDSPGSARTVTGHVHAALAIAAFGAVTAAGFRAARGLVGIWPAGASASRALAWLMLVALAGQFLARPRGPLVGYFGAVERTFYLAAISWSAFAAVGLLDARF